MFLRLLRFVKKCPRFTQDFLDARPLFYPLYLPFEADKVQILQKRGALACITNGNFQLSTALSHKRGLPLFLKNVAH